MNFKLMSNRLLEKLPPERYVVLATIPQDLMLWGDAECFAFENAAVLFEHMHWNEFDYDYYETYEGVNDLNEYIRHNPKEAPRDFAGSRYLIALKKPSKGEIPADAAHEMVELLKRSSDLLYRSKRIIESQSRIPHLIEGSIESLYWDIDDLMVKYGFSQYKFISSKLVEAVSE